MQRLFTSFADGWPGFGLLLQRLVTSICLFYEAMLQCMGMPACVAVVPQLVRIVLAILIAMGLWTPFAGLLLAAAEMWNGFSGCTDPKTAILIATFGLTLAMIGPGAYSIDARLFGRKRIGY